LYVSFEQWTGRRELATLGTNSGSANIPFQRWRHFKEAFAPEVVYEAIKGSETKVASCIDPFGGSGTTALACQFLGVKPTTIEVNPYLADLIEAKLSQYDSDRLVRDFSTVLRIAGRMDPEAVIGRLPATFIEPGVNNRWLFDKQVADRILSLHLAIETLELPAHKMLLKVLLGGTLIELSNAVVNGKGRRYRRGWEKRRRGAGDVDLAFTDAVTAALSEIGRFGRRATSEYTIIRGDSRKEIEGRGPFDVAVFSPPYPNSFDYTDVYNIELWMLGYIDAADGNRALRESTLASHVQIHRSFDAAPSGSRILDSALHDLQGKAKELWNPHIPPMLGAYFAEMLGILASLRAELNDGGRIWAVVGDSRYAGVPFNVAEILAELVQTRGLTVDRLETLREMRTSAQQGGQAQLAEALLVLRKA